MREPFIRSLSVDRDAIGDPAASPFSIPAIASLAELDLDPHVTCPAGANAAGKATLIEAIAVAAGLNLLSAPDVYLHHLGRDGE